MSEGEMEREEGEGEGNREEKERGIVCCWFLVSACVREILTGKQKEGMIFSIWKKNLYLISLPFLIVDVFLYPICPTLRLPASVCLIRFVLVLFLLLWNLLSEMKLLIYRKDKPSGKFAKQKSTVSIGSAIARFCLRDHVPERVLRLDRLSG